MTERKPISIKGLLGNGYDDLYNFKGRYVANIGSRASKKSYNLSTIWMVRLAKYPLSNLLVIRKTYRSLRDSCYAELKKACNRLGLDHEWVFKENPLEAYNIRTKQRIYFRGTDDVLKLTSITTDVGFLNFVWVEEAFEITKENDFDVLDESIRGEIPEGYFKQLVISMNPWNERHWIKHRFFDEIVGFDSEQNPIYKEKPMKEVSKGSFSHISKDKQTLIKRTNYLCNEFLDESDIRLFEEMRIRNPKRYNTAGLGFWGSVDGLIFENWEEKDFTLNDVKTCKQAFGLDWGFANDPTAFVVAYFDKTNRYLYLWDEFFETGMTNRDIYHKIVNMGYGKAKIVADSAEPKSIEELKYLGLRVKPAPKGKDSVNNGIQFMQTLKIFIHPRCTNLITEFSNYAWAKDKFDKTIDKPIDDFNHGIDACLEENTIVKTPNGDFKIKDLVGKSGKIYAYDIDNKKVVEADFKNCRETRKTNELYEIELENGATFKCTYDHKILTSNRGYVMAKDLKETDDIVFMDTL